MYRPEKPQNDVKTGGYNTLQMKKTAFFINTIKNLRTDKKICF